MMNYKLQIPNYELSNYPNPFNPTTTISYKLTKSIKNAKIEIYNIEGQRVKEFNVVLSKDEIGRNIGSVIWNGTDNYRKKVSSGVYLYRIKSEESVLISKKMLLLK